MEVWLLIGVGLIVAWVFASRRSTSSVVNENLPADAGPRAGQPPRPLPTHTAASSAPSTPTVPETRSPVATSSSINSAPSAPRHPPGPIVLKSSPGGRFVVLDFETTGLSPTQGARVIEVSAREVIDGRATKEFLTFVDPGVRVPAEVTQITSITTAMLKGAPRSAVAMRELAAFIGSSPIIGHNVSFDLKFLEHEAGQYFAEYKVRSLCTLLLARRVFPGRPSYRLASLVQEVGIGMPERLHRASADTWVTAHLFDRICRDAHSRSGGMRCLDHDLLDRLQRVRIASAYEWLAAQGSAGAVRLH